MPKRNYAFDPKQLPGEIAIKLKSLCQKYVALDVHKEMIVIGVCDSLGKIIYETIVATEELATLFRR